MIASSAVLLSNLDEFAPDTTVQMDPPRNNPFISAASASFDQGAQDSDVKFTDAPPHEGGFPSAEIVLLSILSNAQRDAVRYPRSARAHLNYGIALLNSQKLEDAATEFETALNLDPRNYVGAMNLARIRVLHKQYDVAGAAYEKLNQEHANNPALLASIAYISMRRGRLDEAETLLRRAVSLDEESLVPRYHLAVVLLSRGKVREAISQLKMAARGDVRSPAVHHILGVAYAAEGDVKRATNSFKTALALDPGMKEAVHALANLYLQHNEADNAIPLLSTYVAREGSRDLAAQEFLAKALENVQRYKEARATLQGILEIEASPERRSLLMNNVAVLFCRERQFEQAAEWLSRAIKQSVQENAIFYNNLAKVFLKQSKAQEAWLLLRQSRERFPTNAETQLLFALSLQMRKQTGEAIQELEDLIRKGRADAEAYADLGWILVDGKRDFTSGLAVLEEGYRKFKNHFGLVNNFAYAHLLRGDVAPARALLENIAGTPSAAETRVALTATWGLLRICEGYIEEGVRNYKEAEEIASREGERDLARAVRQKMHLELGRSYLRNGDKASAMSEVERGLRIKGGRELYREDLEALKSTLQDG